MLVFLREMHKLDGNSTNIVYCAVQVHLYYTYEFPVISLIGSPTMINVRFTVIIDIINITFLIINLGYDH